MRALPPGDHHHVEGNKACGALHAGVDNHQSVENQIRELRQVAERRGWQVTEVYRDAALAALRRKFDVVKA
jgi:hypothetical protein